MYGYLLVGVLCWFGDSILIVAHRGGHGYSPENSLAAIDEAIAAGADMVELDVRMSADSVLVLMHDKSLLRTTGVEGEVHAMPWSTLAGIALLNGKDKSSDKIPTFAAALQHAKGRIKVDIDFKAEGMKAREKAYTVIKQLGMEKQVLFFLYDYKELPALHAINPEITCMPRARSVADLKAILAMDLTRVVHIDPSFEKQPLLKEAQKAGYRFWINALGEVDNQGDAAYAHLLSRFPEASYIQTDRPASWRKFLDGKGR